MTTMLVNFFTYVHLILAFVHFWPAVRHLVKLLDTASKEGFVVVKQKRTDLQCSHFHVIFNYFKSIKLDQSIVRKSNCVIFRN